MLPLFWLLLYTLSTQSWCLRVITHKNLVDLQMCDDDSINIFVTFFSSKVMVDFILTSLEELFVTTSEGRVWSFCIIWDL